MVRLMCRQRRACRRPPPPGDTAWRLKDMKDVGIRGGSVVRLMCRRRHACRRPPPPGDTAWRLKDMGIRAAPWSAWRIAAAAFAAVLLWVALAAANPAQADGKVVEQFLEHYLAGCMRQGGARGHDRPHPLA